MSYRGDFTLGSTFNLKFTTIDAGIPTSVSGAFVAAYPDNSSTEITAGLVFSSDFDSRVGLNNVQVVATSGNGYVTGSNYDIVAISGTVGGKSLVGYVVGSFSIQARSAIGGGSSSSSDPWGTALPGSYTPGQAGHILASRMPTGTVEVGDKTGFSLSSPQVFNLIGNVSGTVTNVTNPVTVGTNNDKTGYSLSSPQFVNISGTITNVVNVINQVTTSGSSGDPWTTVLPGSYSFNTAGSILASRQPSGAVVVSSNLDKTGYSLSTPQVFNLIGNVSGTVTNVLNVVNPVQVTGTVTVGTNNDKTGYGLATGTLLDSISDKVWDETLAGHLSVGSTGEKLNAAGAAGDPWTTSLPGIYVAGSAGHILASRMPTGAVIVGTNNDKTGYSLSSPQNFNLTGNISGTITNTINLLNNVTGSTVISNADITTIASRVWDSTYSPIRTLTTSAGDSIPPAAGDDVFAIRGDTFIWDISGLDLTNVSKVQFSVKKKYNDADSESLIFSESVAGLLYIDGTAAQVPSNSAITYNSTSGTARIRVEAVEMAKLDVANNLPYDIQIIRTTGTLVSSPVQGNFYVAWDSSRSTS